MITAGVKEIKNNLSRYLAQVKAGEEVMITERGKPVARIIQEGRKNISIRDTLAPLTKKGLVTLPVVGLDKNRLECQKVGGRPVSEMIIEDRR